ncbi:MAG: efflux RND transporter periplasmic adaptor subunit [Chloracidobacterium sp.]|nr:efflux RND transporter periplasmic adaptor subunit [Chloracidobacterium sp.]
MDSARQAIVAAQADVDRAQVEVNAANRELLRNQQLPWSGVARSEYDSAKDRVENAKASLNNASLTSIPSDQRKRCKTRLAQQQVLVRDAKRGVDTANLNVASSQSRANQSAAQLRGQRIQRDKTLQVAPINGVIAEIPSKVSTFAVAGLSTTALLTIADMSQINVEVKVDETSIDKVEVGQKAKIKVDAFRRPEIAGEVIQKLRLL